jgi:hypothetical protein
VSANAWFWLLLTLWVIRYNAQDWSHMGSGAVKTPAPTDRSWLKFDERKVS